MDKHEPAGIPPVTRRKFIKTVGAGSIGISAASLLATQSGCGAQNRSETKEDAGGPPAGPAPARDGIDVTLTINKKKQTLNLDPRVTILDLLRENLELYGTKKGCDHGQCGACTVLINGRATNSCLALAVVYSGSEITTVEGLATDTELHPVQRAFVKHDAFQCGYCTPGQIMSAVALFNDGKQRAVPEIRECMSGNICRCGAYPNIVDAVLEAQNSSMKRPEGKS